MFQPESINYEKFDNAMLSFQKVCGGILNLDTSKRLIGKSNAHTFFESYKGSFYDEENRCIRQDTRSIHINRVFSVFTVFQNYMKQENNPGNDNWLNVPNKPVVIDFGAGSPVKGIKIMVSEIYKFAVKQREAARNFIDSHENISEDIMEEMEDEHPELHWADAFLLKIYQLFETVSPTPELTKMLEDRIKFFKQKLCIEDGPPNVASGKGADIGGLVNVLQNTLSSIKLPEGEAMPNGNQIGNVLNTMFSNEGTQNVIQNMLGDLNGCNNFGDIMNKAINSFNDPKISQIMKETVENTVDGALVENQKMKEAGQIETAGKAVEQTE